MLKKVLIKFFKKIWDKLKHGVLNYLRSMKTRKYWIRFLKNCLLWTAVIIGSLIIGLSVRIFLLLSVTIPTGSMYPTLQPGDYVLVNKMIPGPRIFYNWGFLDGSDLTLHRLKGWRKVKRNDVLIFNYPYSNPDKLELDFNVFYAKRCVGIPGDTLCIENGFFRIRNFPDTLGCYENQRRLSRRPPESFGPGRMSAYPWHPAYNWTVKDFGPLYIPGVGDTLAVDSISIVPYIKLVEYETDKRLNISDSGVYLDSVRIERYVFTKNYYFMSGDYVENSRDSRYWGLLPEDLIVGKAFFIWRAKDRQTGKWIWRRFFKSVK